MMGDFLRECRKVMSLTQTELGEKVGLKRGSISHIEAGHGLPAFHFKCFGKLFFGSEGAFLNSMWKYSIVGVDVNFLMDIFGWRLAMDMPKELALKIIESRYASVELDDDE